MPVYRFRFKQLNRVPKSVQPEKTVLHCHFYVLLSFLYKGKDNILILCIRPANWIHSGYCLVWTSLAAYAITNMLDYNKICPSLAYSTFLVIFKYSHLLWLYLYLWLYDYMKSTFIYSYLHNSATCAICFAHVAGHKSQFSTSSPLFPL